MSSFGKKYTIESASELAAVIANDGYHPQATGSDDPRLTIRDAVMSNDLSALFPHAVTEIMVEATEPILTLTPLLDVINAEGAATHEWRMPAIGTFTIERVAEGQAYPQRRLQMGGSTVTCTIDKYGVALGFSPDAIEASRWDLLGMHLREAGRAFARKKETVVADHIRGLGEAVFDNLNPSLSRRGITTGRDIAMAPNGTLTVDDLFEAYHDLLHKGYMADLLIMHPATYMMFIKDPLLRAFVMQNGGGVVFQNYTGQARNGFPRPAGTQMTIASGSRNAGLGQFNTGAPSKNSDFNPALTSAPVLPSYLPFPLRIIVSPFMPYDTVNRLTDIIMCDSSSLGAVVVKHGLRQVNWSDPEHDLQYMRFDEAYAPLMYEEGMGSLVFRNVKCDQNWFPGMPGSADFDITSISVIDRTTGSPL
jgi:hypothetical protein